MLKEFKEFIMRGNVIDMAVGVIIGSAFGSIVSSVVNDIFMPFIGVLIGGVNFSDLKIVLSPAVIEAGEVIKTENALLYGQFLQALFDFLIIAMFVFLVIKMMNHFKKPVEKVEEAPVITSEDLLGEIRDILKERN